MIIKKELIQREIAGDTVLVPIGKTVLDTTGLFVLNELGSFIWGLLPKVETAQEICDAVLEEYDVAPAVAAQDVAEFLCKLEELQII